jgi:hypothetical protein
VHHRKTFLVACSLAVLLCGSLARGGQIELRNNYYAYMFAASTALTGSQFPETLAEMDDHVTVHAWLGGALPDWNFVDRAVVAVLSNSTISAGERVQNYMLDLNLDPSTDVVSIYNRGNQFLSRWNAPTVDAAGIAVGDFSQFEHAVTYDENGFPVGASEVWTGSNADGTSTGLNANDWTSNTAVATYGLANAVGPAAFNAGAGSSVGNIARPVYALLISSTPLPEQIEVWVPEPSALALAGLGGLGLGLAVWRRRRVA